MALTVGCGGNLFAQSQRPQSAETGEGETVMLSPSAVRRVAQAQQSQTGATGDASAEVVMLSPFVVSTDRDVGFVAAASLAGGRLGGDLKDTPVAYSVLTSEFIEALSLTDLSDMAQWLPNSTEERNSGNLEWSNNDFYIASRGVGAGAPQRDFFPYGFNFDGYNTDRLDMGRGPNSILFGNSGYAGTANSVSKRAILNRQFTMVNLGYSSWNNVRSTLDHNQSLGRKFALRLNALYLDRDGWRDHDFEEKKAITLAGTWSPTKNTELRFEAEVGEKDLAALGSNLDDHFSAWSGTHTYSGPIPSGGSAPAGISPYQNDTIIFTPSSGAKLLANYKGWARTAASTAVNARDTPIGQRLNLPSDMLETIEANSHFTTPSRKQTAYVDAPLYTEKYYNYTLAATHQIKRKFYAEAAVNFSGVEKSGDRYSNGGLTRMYIDVNTKLPNGQDNPNFLEPYGEGPGRPHIRTSDNINARLALAYVLDNTRYGSFRINALGGYSRSDSKQDTWVYAIKDNEDHRYWPTEKLVYFRYYHNTDTSRPYDLSDRKWTFLDTGASPRIATAGLVRGELATSTMNQRSLTEYNYIQFAGDAKFFKKRLNLLAALRMDDHLTRQRVTISQFDYPTDWNGRDLILKPDAPSDWASLTYQIRDAAGNPSGPVLPADIRPRITTAGDPHYGEGDPRYNGVRFQDDYNTPEKKETTTTYSFGAVYHLNQNISLFANYAESFVPTITRYSIEGNMLDARSGDGRDFGVRITALKQRFMANIIRYTGREKNTGAALGLTFNYIDSIVRSTPVGFSSVNEINKRNLAPPHSGIGDTVTSEVSGWELDITANMTRGWRLMVNGSLTDAYQTDTYPHMRNYLARNEATLRLIVEDAGGAFRGDAAYVDTAIPAGSRPDADSAVGAWNNLQAWRASLTHEKQKRSRLVGKTMNVFTDYTLRNGPLKGLRIGVGANYRGRSVIGYRGSDTVTIEGPGGTTQVIDDPFVGPLDVVYQPGYTIATATLYYEWRVNRKTTVKFNLRVANLFDYDKPIYYESALRPVLSPVDGKVTSARTMTPVKYYWITPRNFTFSASVRF
ncbi:TonB-dependent receptor [Termitidicoccus mucosus]|uniref:TonB-dependent receptor-like beta-barrel domain-containing protein n=1 Tax=Termitidicoccus mucosus TaxID=1184151 RepID=A0A178IHA1_9BACT|nr:hypothetical protein AW736_17030 [Opitutaceae bacterium TSB47]